MGFDDTQTIVIVGEVISQTASEVSKVLLMVQQVKESIYSLHLNWLPSMKDGIRLIRLSG